MYRGVDKKYAQTAEPKSIIGVLQDILNVEVRLSQLHGLVFRDKAALELGMKRPASLSPFFPVRETHKSTRKSHASDRIVRMPAERGRIALHLCEHY